MALDPKLMFALHASAMVMFAVGGALTVAIEASVQAALIALAVSIAVVQRLRNSWRWAGAGAKQIAGAAGSIGLIAIFIGAAVPEFPPGAPQAFPWYVLAAQIGVFNALTSLRLARMSRQEFEMDCRPETPATPATAAGGTTPAATRRSEPAWHTWARGLFGVAFVGVWLTGVASFYFHGVAVRDGASAPGGRFTTPLTEHGRTVYVTAADWARDQALMTTMMYAIPAMMVTGLLLHFVVRVRLFDNVPYFEPKGRS